MKVIAAKKVTEKALTWLINHGAAIEQGRGLELVFLPSPQRLWTSEAPGYPGYIEDGNNGMAVLIEWGKDDTRCIYSIEDEEW